MSARWVLLALGLALAPAAARAAGSPRIVLVAPEPGDRVAVRIRAELRALRFEVVDAEPAPGPPARAPLAEVARERGAVAAVRLVPSSAGVEVWIVDRITGKTVLREVLTEEPGSAAGSATVALRVVELLRASLMELDAPGPPRGEVTLPEEVRGLLAPSRRSPATPPPPGRPIVSIEVGPTLLVSPGGLGPEGAVQVAAHLAPESRVAASLFAMVPLVPASASGPEGSATLRFGIFGGGARVRLAAPGARWAPVAGAGVSALWMSYDGKPGAGWVGASGDAFTVAPWLRVGLGVAVAPRLRLRADLLGGVAVRRPAIQFGERVAARWGAPFFAPSIGIELAL